ncbi:hypothetical protein WL29_23320 [Burkholderia ubonensis]|uniref:Uncharacterized protein n=1 Tax=Burkholderia ubonensis TaxID=101571 RepID=A0A106QD81_9BURK|nr:hypothetical protein [Burkholderia ubonensis]KWA84290.1 hypothetical protein WL29_23320 [Burkholderia ubonensis]
MAAYILLVPRCRLVTPDYKVVASDVRGILEYCIAESDFVPRRGRQYNVQPGAVCGLNKAELAAKAVAMTRQAEVADRACNTRVLRPTEAFAALVDRVQHGFTGVPRIKA